MPNTVIYLKRPLMSAAFAVVITFVDGNDGQIDGPEVEKVAKFLRISEGVPQFDLEHDGRLFCACRLASSVWSDSIAFSFDSMVLVESGASDPSS